MLLLPGHEVWTVAFRLPIVLDVVDPVDTRGQGAVATVCVKVLVKVAHRNVGISLGGIPKFCYLIFIAFITLYFAFDLVTTIFDHYVKIKL